MSNLGVIPPVVGGFGGREKKTQTWRPNRSGAPEAEPGPSLPSISGRDVGCRVTPEITEEGAEELRCLSPLMSGQKRGSLRHPAGINSHSKQMQRLTCIWPGPGQYYHYVKFQNKQPQQQKQGR